MWSGYLKSSRGLLQRTLIGVVSTDQRITLSNEQWVRDEEDAGDETTTGAKLRATLQEPM